MSEDHLSARVAYLGPEGTYSHAAVLKYFGEKASCQPFADIPDVFDSVERDDSDFGLLPVENSTEGSVTLTLDCFSSSTVLICGEVMLPIHHNLLTGPGTDSQNLVRIVSHQQSLAQCRAWLKKHYSGVDCVSVSSNAEAAMIASREQGVGAIASQTAAVLYGLNIAAKNIEDTSDNTTRFLAVNRTVRPEPTGNDKTSIIISAHDEPGTLFRALEPFHRFGVSLTKLESRPSRKTAWSYAFYIDIAGHVQDEGVALALRELDTQAFEVKNLGSYPRAE